jgi:putative flippase GtrA
MRWVVIAALVLIIASLFTSLFYVYKDRGTGSKRAVKALTVRVGLSVSVFLLLIVSYKMGWIGQTRL